MNRWLPWVGLVWESLARSRLKSGDNVRLKDGPKAENTTECLLLLAEDENGIARLIAKADGGPVRVILHLVWTPHVAHLPSSSVVALISLDEGPVPARLKACTTTPYWANFLRLSRV